ncbi:Rossmann-fold NAD(P)-binding domain-containing protein [Halalkalicoccus ordinarius]|uniref:hypothetical protein n=1 Tax=Halalkalicoccus ordinarius TaxID=3116651 RepID=UPI00300F2320
MRVSVTGATGFVGERLIEQLAHWLPVMITPRWVRTDCQPIAIGDVIASLVDVLEAPESTDETFETGGPEVGSSQTMMYRTSEPLGKRQYIVPVLTPKLWAYWLDLVNDVPCDVAQPLVSELRNSVVVSDQRIRDLLPIDLTPFETAVSRALEGDGAE